MEGYQVRSVRLGAVIAVAAVAAFAVWYFAIRDDNSSSTTSPATTATQGVQSIPAVEKTPSELASLSRQIHQPIYWAGAQPNTKLEFIRTGDGATYVRYL